LLGQRDGAIAGLVNGHRARHALALSQAGLGDLRYARAWRQEQQLLAPFVQRAREGGMLTVAELQHAYRDRVGQDVAHSTIYRLLETHGWRKVVPPPRHTKQTLRRRPP
jgi:hypothetical protein